MLLRIWIYLIALITILCGCSNVEVGKPNFPAAHVEYFKNYGWTLKEYEAVNTYESGSLPIFKEHYELLVNEGKLDLAPCASKDIMESGYDLEEAVGSYNDNIGYVVECEGKTIGGYLTLQTETLHGDIYDITTGPTVPIVKREDM